MNILVIICTLNRPEVLHDTVRSLRRQTHLPSQVLIGTPGPQHILPETLAIEGVKYIETPLGLCKQRNKTLEHVSSDTELVAFFDDDMELTPSYLAEMSRLFERHPEILIASGRLLYDGGRGRAICRAEAVKICEVYRRTHEKDAPLSYRPAPAGYGCNMVVRYSAIGTCRFDERLPLYAWLEDHDFSYRCTAGRCAPVAFDNAVAVHMGTRSGRVSEVRIGFSTVVNPMYLRRKARVFSFPVILVNYWLRCTVGNVLGLVRRDTERDRIGLIRGNLLGYWHLLTGRCDPEYVLMLSAD